MSGRGDFLRDPIWQFISVVTTAFIGLISVLFSILALPNGTRSLAILLLIIILISSLVIIGVIFLFLLFRRKRTSAFFSKADNSIAVSLQTPLVDKKQRQKNSKTVAFITTLLLALSPFLLFGLFWPVINDLGPMYSDKITTAQAYCDALLHQDYNRAYKLFSGHTDTFWPSHMVAIGGATITSETTYERSAHAVDD